MLTLITAQGLSFPLEWIGISDFDGSLRFETSESDLNRLYSVFTDSAHTMTLTRVFDEDRRVFSGFTFFKGIERMASGNIVVRLMEG